MSDMDRHSMMSRRVILKRATHLGIASLISYHRFGQALAQPHQPPVQNPYSPINRSRDQNAHTHVSGDQPHWAHQVLWNSQAYFKAHPSKEPIPERHKVVIIGGGMSGLSTAWKLRQFNPVLLERQARLGGNSQAETWHGLPYSIAAAYLVQPDDGSPIDQLIKDTHIQNIFKTSHIHPKAVLNGKLTSSLDDFDAHISAESKSLWQKLKQHLLHICHEKNGLTFPQIPTEDAQSRSHINQLDHMSFADYLKQWNRNDLPPQIQLYLEHYCWTAFAASSQEISAASALNFLASESAGLWIAHGGNAGIADAVYQKLLTSVPQSNFRCQQLVYSVEVKAKKVHIHSINEQGQKSHLIADRVVMCCPKFVVKRILKDIEATRLQAITQLKYRAYVVANALINAPIKDDFYEIYLMNQGHLPKYSDIQADAQAYGITDLTYGNFHQVDQKRSVLTLYRALPYDQGRTELYSDLSLKRMRVHFKQELLDKIFPVLGLQKTQLDHIRFARWGHALPVASPGLIHRGVVDQLRAPFKDQVFFAQQDNWALPAIETAVHEAFRASQQVIRSLN